MLLADMVLMMAGVCGISEDDIELHAMGRLKDPILAHHLETCPTCREAVQEEREKIALLKQALRLWCPKA